MINKIKEFINGLDNKKIGLLAIISLIILYADYSLILGPQISGLRGISAKAGKLKSELGSLKNDLANIENLKKNYAKLKKEAGSGSKKLIHEQDIGALMQSISEAANRNNINIEQMKPSKESMPAGQKAGPQDFTAVLLDLEITGGYHNYGRFLNDLEGLDTFVAVAGMNIVSSGSDLNRQKIKLVLRTYVRK